MMIKCPLCSEHQQDTEILDHLVDYHHVPAETIWLIPTGEFNDRAQLKVAVELVAP